MKKYLALVCLLIFYSMRGAAMKLPDYQAVDFNAQLFPKVLRLTAKKLTFPLTQEDIEDIKTLEKKYDQEDNCAGLAAPQIGISKQVIVFAANEPDLKKWRPDFTQNMPKTIWINPSYEPIGDEKHEDYEGCFSVIDRAGTVNRYQKIRYKAYNLQGELQEGIAEGFLARLIQHEIDHLNGKLFIDLIPENELMSIESYRMMRSEAMKKDEE
jgi:peptide deformylase